jgi:hypothetical protein
MYILYMPIQQRSRNNPPKRVILFSEPMLAFEHQLIYPTHNHLTVHHRLRLLGSVDDKQHGDLEFQNHHCCYCLVLDYLAAGFAAGVAAAGAASTLAGALLAGAALASTLQVLSLAGSHLAGAATTTEADAAGAGALTASAANADAATKVAIRVTIDFILNFLRLL